MRFQTRGNRWNAIYFLLGVVAILGVVGCDENISSPPVDESVLIDTWHLYKRIIYIENRERKEENIAQIFADDGSWTYPDSIFYLRLKSDHTYKWVFDTPDDSSAGTWLLDGDEIVINNFFPDTVKIDVSTKYDSAADEIIMSIHRFADSNTKWEYFLLEDFHYKRRKDLVSS